MLLHFSSSSSSTPLRSNYERSTAPFPLNPQPFRLLLLLPPAAPFHGSERCKILTNEGRSRARTDRAAGVTNGLPAMKHFRTEKMQCRIMSAVSLFSRKDLFLWRGKKILFFFFSSPPLQRFKAVIHLSGCNFARKGKRRLFFAAVGTVIAKFS